MYARKAHIHFPRIASECFLLLAFISQRAALFVFTDLSDVEPLVHIQQLCEVEIVFQLPFFLK